MDAAHSAFLGSLDMGDVRVSIIFQAYQRLKL